LVETKDRNLGVLLEFSAKSSSNKEQMPAIPRKGALQLPTAKTTGRGSFSWLIELLKGSEKMDGGDSVTGRFTNGTKHPGATYLRGNKTR